MFAGHIGMALVATRIEPRIRVDAWVAASLLLDILLWGFVLLGWESVQIPADFAATHQPSFVFPYSHGLLASVGWSLMAGGAAAWWLGPQAPARGRASALAAAVVFSHWLLDAWVHRPELPVAGPHSPLVGAGLWNHMPVALAVEAALLLFGVLVLMRMPLRTSGWRPGRRWGLIAVCIVVLGFTIAGMTVAPPPPSARAMAASSLGTIVALCALMGWLGRPDPARTMPSRF